MSKLLDKMRSTFGVKRGPEDAGSLSLSMDTLQRGILQIAKLELERDLQRHLPSVENEKDRNALTTAFKARVLILDQGISKVDRATMEALINATVHPKFNISRVMLGDPVRHLAEHRMAYILNMSLFFGLLVESGVKEKSLPAVMTQLGHVTGSRGDLVELRKEPDEYLRALIRMFAEMPMELIMDRPIDHEILAMIKSDPTSVNDIMSFAIQRDTSVADIDISLLREAISTPSVTLREGAL